MTQDTPNQSELKPCWTCCGVSYAEVQASHQFPHALYRCVNCKAVYPDFALRPQPEGTSALADELERTPAQFFFEVGYGACWAEAYIRNNEQPPFELTDKVVERAWEIAPEAHDDHAEFDRYLALANTRTPKPAITEEAVEAVSIPRELFDFLMGSRSIEGYWFGDTRPDMRGAFWWRSVIRDRALSTSPVTKPDEKGDFQDRVDAWMDVCFGAEIKADVQERSDRFIEEALEFVQAAGYSAERAHALVDYTFGRPQGEINQEVGGVMVTLAAMCNTLGVPINEAAEAELARIWTKVDAIRAKQAAKPTGSALPIALRASPPPDIREANDAS